MGISVIILTTNDGTTAVKDINLGEVRCNMIALILILVVMTTFVEIVMSTLARLEN
jgi:hypothetical protein